MKNKEIDWWRTSFGSEEIRNLAKAISEEHISQGPVTAEFEAAFAKALNVPYAVATTSGSVALLMALMALGIKAGDEVIVPNRTFIATAHAALLLGAKVVLVDVLPDIPALDVSQIKRKITRKTKAIIPVHLNGRAVGMGELGLLARKHGLLVVEDACQAMFSRNEVGFLGTQSDAGAFSLGVTKLISTGQGGVVVTRSRKTYERLKLLRNHGVSDTFDSTYTRFGYNFKFTDLQATIGLVQLKRVPSRLANLKNIYTRYVDWFESSNDFNLRIIPVNLAFGETPLYTEVLSHDKERLRSYLAVHGIRIRPFLPPLHQSPHLNNTGKFPNSERFFDQGVFLPSGPDQPLAHIERVIKTLQEFVRSIVR